MAVTGGGTPYVEATDLVATYPATSLTLANKVDTKVDYALPVNAQTGTTYTFVLADGLRLTTASNAAASTYTVPPQSSVVWLANSVIRLVNYGAGVVTVAGGSGVTVTNAAKTLAQFESVALIRTGSDAWTLVPFSGGVSNANFSDAATGTYTDGGFNYKYITYTASGTLTVTTAGFADVLVVGGGAGGGQIGVGGAVGAGGGGAGGYLDASSVYLPSGSLTVVVGAGGAGGVSNFHGVNGISSRLGTLYGVGGGGGAANNLVSGLPGGSGGGAAVAGGGSQGAGSGTSGQGNSGGGASASGSGGGGGASAVGAAGGTNTGGNGGSGTASSITGSSVTRAGGGGGSAQTTAGSGGAGGGGNAATSGNGTAGGTNLGGGGGATNGAASGGAGGSGVVIVRVKV